MIRVLMEVRFLIPLREDADLGNGEKHPFTRWEALNNDLFSMFGGYTRGRMPVDGVYTDPDTEMPVFDESILYMIALSAPDVDKLRAYLRDTASRLFAQKSIYFFNGSHVEFLENPDHAAGGTRTNGGNGC